MSSRGFGSLRRRSDADLGTTPGRTRFGRVLPVVVLLSLTAAFVASCSDDAARNEARTQPTTGTVKPTTTTSVPGAPAPDDTIPGLWLLTPAGLLDENLDAWATPGDGETLRDPVDDGRGGVVYVRCGKASGCGAEEAADPARQPRTLGLAEHVYAVGEYRGVRSMLVTGSGDDALADPSTGEPIAGPAIAVVRVRERDPIGGVSGTSGAGRDPPRCVRRGWQPRRDRRVCGGERQLCDLPLEQHRRTVRPLGRRTDGTGIAALERGRADEHHHAPEAAPIVSLAVPDGGAVTWVTRTGDGQVAVNRAGEPPMTFAGVAGDDAVTDGKWLAVRKGDTVTMIDLANPEHRGTRKVPADTSRMAIREGGAGGSGGRGML
ncbi:MAG: hypothetical protein R2698_03670 [Microthrixaceae bacterium]